METQYFQKYIQKHIAKMVLRSSKVVFGLIDTEGYRKSLMETLLHLRFTNHDVQGHVMRSLPIKNQQYP